MNAVVQQDHRLLKAIVAGLGVVFLVLLAIVVATLIRRAGKKPVAPAGVVVLPAGAQIEDTLIGPDGIVLKLKGAGGETLIFLDGKTGRETGRVTLVPPDAPAH